MKSKLVPLSCLSLVALGLVALSFQNCGRFQPSKSSELVVPSSGELNPNEGRALGPGYDIFIVAGQSNSVGFGLGPFLDPTASAELDQKIFQIGRLAESNLQVVPAADYLEHWFTTNGTQRGTGKGFGPTFARLYVAKVLASERRVLLIPAGVPGVASFQWDDVLTPAPSGRPDFVDSKVFLSDLKMRIQIALSLPGGNHRVVGLLWHQGESDVPCLQPNFWCHPLTPAAQVFSQRLRSVFEVLRAEGRHNFPIIMGTFVPTWDGEMESSGPLLEQKKLIEDAILNLTTSVPSLGVIDVNGLRSNGDVGFGTDPVHFSAQSQVDMGFRYFETFQRISAQSK